MFYYVVKLFDYCIEISLYLNGLLEKNKSKYHTDHKSNLSALGFVLYLGGIEYMSSCGCWQLTFLDTHGLENRQLFVHNQLALGERTLLSFQVVARFNILLDFDYIVWFKGLFTTTMRQTLTVLFFFYAYSIIEYHFMIVKVLEFWCKRQLLRGKNFSDSPKRTSFSLNWRTS